MYCILVTYYIPYRNICKEKEGSRMTKIWSFMLIFSLVIALITGNIEMVVTSIMDSSKGAVENVITLIGMMCFWNGMFHIFSKTQAIQKFSKCFSRILSPLFDKKQMNEKAMEYMSLNISTNVIGVGNAATINGIKAMEELQKENNSCDNPTNNMTTFVLLNTASLQLIPTSMIALRATYGSSAPSAIVIPVWIVTFIALTCGIISIKILNKKIE